MNSKQLPIRALGQRSLASSHFFRPSNAVRDSKDAKSNNASEDGSRVSLSDFLDRKLHKASVVPKIVKGKATPFSSPLGSRDVGESVDRNFEIEEEEGENDSALGKVVFEQFKHISAEKGDNVIGSCNAGEVGSSNVDGIGQQPRKRRNPFEDGNGKYSTLKRVLVLGDDPRPRHKRREERLTNNNKPTPAYDHYANGSGWWDGDMEGIDSELSFNEIWEGVGSSTLGGIDWH